MPTWLWVIIGIVCSTVAFACIDIWCGEWEQPHLHIDSPPTRKRTPADKVDPPKIPTKEQR